MKLACVAFFVIFGCNSGCNHINKTLIEKEFATVGGEKITLRVSDIGAQTVQGDFIEIGEVGFTSRGMPEDPKRHEMATSFNLSVPEDLVLDNLQVSIVSPIIMADTILAIDSLTLVAGSVWKGLTEFRPMGKSSTPWIYGKGASEIVYRFEFTPSVGAPFIMHQAGVFPEMAKSVHQQLAR